MLKQTLFKQTFLAARIMLSFATLVQARSIEAPQTTAEETPFAPAETTVVTQTTLADGQGYAPVIYHGQGQPYVRGFAAYPRAVRYPTRPGWREECAYYRSVRQAIPRQPCCDRGPSQFGPLWSSYCSDRLAGSGTACPTAPPRQCGIRGWPGGGHCVQSTCDGYLPSEDVPDPTAKEHKPEQETTPGGAPDLETPPQPEDVHGEGRKGENLARPGKTKNKTDQPLPAS